MIAGLGSNANNQGGGKGGDFFIHGGEARGKHFYDDGGNVEVTGGLAEAGYGGSFLLETGYSLGSSSGIATLFAATAATMPSAVVVLCIPPTFATVVLGLQLHTAVAEVVPASSHGASGRGADGHDLANSSARTHKKAQDLL